MYHGLIDGDILAYKAGYITDKVNTDYKDLINEMIFNWISTAWCSTYQICFGDRSYRKDLYPDYKSQRKEESKPSKLQEIKEYLFSQPETIQFSNVETDDILGILSTGQPAKIAPECVIITVDKDLKQIPGWHFNPDKDLFPVRVCQMEGMLALWTQVITGDRSDGYAGINGIGPKKAYGFLSDVVSEYGTGSVYEQISVLYELHNTPLEYVSRNFQMAKILTYDDITDESKQNITVPGSRLEPADWYEIIARASYWL